MTFGKWTEILSSSKRIAVAVGFAVLAMSSPAEARPWAEHAGKLSSLSHQIESGEAEIHELIEHKRHAEDPAEVKALVEQIGARHKALEKTNTDYEKEREHVRFEHPEKNDVLDHKYVRHEFKTLEELEGDFGIQGRLDRMKARVLSMFPIPERSPRPEFKKPADRVPASKQFEVDEEAVDKIHLVK